MNSFHDLVRRRQSCRRFDPSRPIDREALTACLEAARLAPSACNSQPWRFIAVDEPARVRQVAECVQDAGLNRFVTDCPAFVVVVEEGENLTARMGATLKNQQYSTIDIGLATAHLVLAATEQGLDSCVLGWFNERRLKTVLAIPKTRRVRLVVALGYAMPDEPLRDKQRKEFDEIARFNKF